MQSLIFSFFPCLGREAKSATLATRRKTVPAADLARLPTGKQQVVLVHIVNIKLSIKWHLTAIGNF